MPDHPVDENYARLSLMAGMLAYKLDSYLDRAHFITKARERAWSLTEELLVAWQVEALALGVPERVARLSKKERSIIERAIPAGQALQAAYDKHRQ